jgi:uncharacterized protein (UPF0333 family)
VRGERGQASLELLAGFPALLLAALVALQLLVTAFAFHLADNAAEAGALAVAAGAEAEPAARAALPGWARERIAVSRDDGRVVVALRPPAPIAAVSDALEISASAWALPADG